jgi:acyl-CoA thioester hydrolase
MMTRAEGWPDLGGRLTPRGHLLAVRIYFEDTDFTGMVYHANFLKFMERARSDMLRLSGINHEALKNGLLGQQLAFVVTHIEIGFLKPAGIDDVVEIETIVAKTTAARVVLSQTVRRGGDILVEASVTVVMVNPTGRAQKIPAVILEKLSPGEHA